MSNKDNSKHLLRKSQELENEVVQLRQIATILIESNDWYQIIFNTCPFGIAITDLDLNLLDANSALLQLLQYESVEDLKLVSLKGILPTGHFRKLKESIKKESRNKGIVEIESSVYSSRQAMIPGKITACVSRDDHGNPSKIACFVENYLEQRQLKEQLNQKEKTIENLKEELQAKQQELEQFQTQSKKKQKEFEESIILNIKEIVVPYIEKLKKSDLSDFQRENINTIQDHLDEVISPFYKVLTSKYSDLTPMEIRIAGLVKDGKTTREMAEILGLSTGTVEFHRNNLRKKLNIRNTNVNLRSHLLTID